MEGYFMHVSHKVAEARFGKDEEEKLTSVRELKTWKFWRAVLAELVGTLLFVFLGCASTVTTTPDPVRVYWLGPILGGVIASLLYKFLFKPYRGAISNEEAFQKLVAEGNLIAIPRDYLAGSSDSSTKGKQMESLKM